jgi:hypothetical protein
MSNHSFTHEQGYIEQVYVGAQTKESVTQNFTATQELIPQLPPSSKVNILVNLLDMTTTDTGSREVAVQYLQTLHYYRLAVITTSAYLKHVANLVIRASGQSHHAQVFSDRAHAVNWLQTE